jgi:hypothetical protein
VNELHSKLRKIESSCDENALIGRTSATVLSTSPKFYKNLKKIKRNHGGENPTKNYYLAFPALSSKKATTTITSGEIAAVSGGETKAKAANSDLKLLCWSNLMSNSTKEISVPSTSTPDGGGVKLKPRRSRRYQRRTKCFKENDVQCENARERFSPKAKNVSKKNQRNQYGELLSVKRFARNCVLNKQTIFSTATSKNSTAAAKSCVNARSTNLQSSSSSGAATKVNWDMDFKGHWEMDRDLISEFYQQQQTHPVEVTSTSQVDECQTMNDDDDAMLMKFLPTKLMDDDGGEMLKKEMQSISSLKSKFDANVKALWNDVDDPLTKPLTYKSFDDDDGGNASLVSSFSSEKNSLGLFNFNGHRPTAMMEVIAPMYTLDCNNNNNSSKAFKVNHYSPSSSTISPGSLAAEKFIKSGTNLQSSIWSDGEFNSCETECLIYKDVSIIIAYMHKARVKVNSRPKHVIHVLFFLFLLLFLGRRSQCRRCHLQANEVNRCRDEKLAERER